MGYCLRFHIIEIEVFLKLQRHKNQSLFYLRNIILFHVSRARNAYLFISNQLSTLNHTHDRAVCQSCFFSLSGNRVLQRCIHYDTSFVFVKKSFPCVFSLIIYLLCMLRSFSNNVWMSLLVFRPMYASFATFVCRTPLVWWDWWRVIQPVRRWTQSIGVCIMWRGMDWWQDLTFWTTTKNYYDKLSFRCAEITTILQAT